MSDNTPAQTKPKTVRTGKLSVVLPNKPSALAAMGIATTPEAAAFLCAVFEEKLTEGKQLEKGKKFLNKMRDFAENVRLQRVNRPDPWLGNPSNVLTDFQNLQRQLVEGNRKTVNDKVKGAVKMDLALHDSTSQLLRGFSENGKKVDPELEIALDGLFNSWLSSKNILSKGSVLYECDENGVIKKDASNEPIRVSKERVKRLLNHKNEGLEKFLKDQGISLTLKEHKYPERKVPQPAAVPATPGEPEVVQPSEAPQTQPQSGAR